MFKKNNELDLYQEKIELKKRELLIVEDEIKLKHKLADTNKFAELITENYNLKKEVERLRKDRNFYERAVLFSIENGTNIVEKNR